MIPANWKRRLAALTATAAATGGLMLAAPAAHAASGSCSGEGYTEVDYADGGSLCDLSHSSHRIPINRCDVVEIDAGANWVATWIGASKSSLRYHAFSPWTVWVQGRENFCVGDIAINP